MQIKQIPLSIPFHKLFEVLKDNELPFFLDSGSGYEEKLGQYSFMGSSPIACFKAKNDRIQIMESGEWTDYKEADSLEAFRDFSGRYQREGDGAFPFCGGLVGFFSYDLCHKIEKLPRTAKDDKKIPDIFFGVYDGVYIFDHQSEKVFAAAHGIAEPEDVILSRLVTFAEDAENMALTARPGSEKDEVTPIFECNFTREEYLQSVKKIKRYIKSGDIYQANLTQRFETKYTGDSWELYQTLRRINPAPFASYFNYGDFQIVSSSPERFVKLEKRNIQTRPIKGTIARGRNEEEDAINRDILIHSEKDKSELLMIVDLARNDLGRISKTGTVRVEELFKLETYPTVYHLVAGIHGILRDEIDHTDIIRAAFPGGSITGTPKIRAMEIIDEIEPTQRNIYTGSIGYIDFFGNMDLNIVIRTILVKNGKASFQVGGAIVWDSEEEAEFEETIIKGRAMKKALGG